MRVIIAGSREGVTQADVDQAMEDSGWIPDITMVVSGRAIGADTFGERWAEERGIQLAYFPVTKAMWAMQGKRAGHIRNAKMAQHADALVLVWDGRSRGSANMLVEAASRSLKLFQRVVRHDDDKEEDHL